MRPGQKRARPQAIAAKPRTAEASRALVPRHPPIATTAVVDLEVGQLFLQLRRALGIPGDTLARLLGTTPATIAALESGQISRLPAWPETERVVRAYTAMAGIDPRPMLSRIRTRLIPPSAPVAVRSAPVQAPASSGRQPEKSVPALKTARKRARLASGARMLVPVGLRDVRISRRMAAVSTAVGVIGALFMAVGPLYSAMPLSAQRAITAAIDKVAWGSVTLPDGMRLIDPANPRARRGDKLQTAGR